MQKSQPLRYWNSLFVFSFFNFLSLANVVVVLWCRIQRLNNRIEPTTLSMLVTVKQVKCPCDPSEKDKSRLMPPKATGNGSTLLHSVIQSSDAAGSSSNNTTLSSNTTQQQQPPPPVTSTDVDDPSHPLFRHRRTVTDFDYGPVLGEGSYSTVGDTKQSSICI